MRDKDGRTPLHYAFIGPPKYITSIYNRLVKAGANENIIDKVCYQFLNLKVIYLRNFIKFIFY